AACCGAAFSEAGSAESFAQATSPKRAAKHIHFFITEFIGPEHPGCERYVFFRKRLRRHEKNDAIGRNERIFAARFCKLNPNDYICPHHN
ncbi:MAG: hypothetical protein K2J53_06095, partial [Alistipes sp.]|nr:hypothetical protein [Alistipes sp.]